MSTFSRERCFIDFCVFAKKHLASGDIDPAYPVLKHHYESCGLSEEGRLWHTFLYTTFYHLGSAESAWRWWPERAPIVSIQQTIRTGVERRMFRGQPQAVVSYLNGAVVHFNHWGSMETWMAEMVNSGGSDGWQRVRAGFEQIRGNGPWSSYKWADLMKNVHGYPLKAADIGIGGKGKTAGPIPGMQAVTGLSVTECLSLSVQERLFGQCIDAGVPFSGLDQMETSLCDFNSLINGRYYVGHDIDMMMEQLRQSGPCLWEARAQCFDASYLGECGGWYGVRRELKTVYAKTRRIV